MVDIGGGTTDVSFFTIIDDKTIDKKDRLRIYDFKSINKGLNFLTEEFVFADYERTDSNIRNAGELNKASVSLFKKELNLICTSLRKRLYNEFKIQGDLPDESFTRAMKRRPIVYTGGGSSFPILRNGYDGFKDVIYISKKNWNVAAIKNIKEIEALGLCPILSTAYGLSISRINDDIVCEPFRDIFSGIRHTKGQSKIMKKKTIQPAIPPKAFGHDIGGSGGFNYMDDWDAWK